MHVDVRQNKTYCCASIKIIDNLKLFKNMCESVFKWMSLFSTDPFTTKAIQRLKVAVCYSILHCFLLLPNLITKYLVVLLYLAGRECSWLTKSCNIIFGFTLHWDKVNCSSLLLFLAVLGMMSDCHTPYIP